VIRPDTVLATTVHPLQVVDESCPKPSTTSGGLIVTSDEAIWCTEPHWPQASSGSIWTQAKITEVPALAALAARR
jgi:5-formyltetrahydrofolate cyclo-ligase